MPMIVCVCCREADEQTGVDDKVCYTCHSLIEDAQDIMYFDLIVYTLSTDA
jgi:hypothetical protein